MKKANQELKRHIKSRFGTIRGCLMTVSSRLLLMHKRYEDIKVGIRGRKSKKKQMVRHLRLVESLFTTSYNYLLSPC